MAVNTKVCALATLSFLGVSGWSLLTNTAPATAQGTLPTTPVRARRMERHPEIRKAMRHLEMAQKALQAAAHDFAGHREQALDMTQKAIAQCQAALAADTK